MSITNLQLTVLKAAYCGSKDLDIFQDTHIYREQVSALINHGMLMFNNPDAEYRYKLTDKGRYWHEYILSVPFPTEYTAFKIEIEK